MPNSFSPEKFIEDDFVFPAESTAIIEVLEVQQSPLQNELKHVRFLTQRDCLRDSMFSLKIFYGSHSNFACTT